MPAGAGGSESGQAAGYPSNVKGPSTKGSRSAQGKGRECPSSEGSTLKPLCVEEVEVSHVANGFEGHTG